MPTEFQKAMDKELSNIHNTNVFLDDLLIVTNGTRESHYQAVKQVLEKRMKVGLKWEKFNYPREEIECLGYKLTRTGIKPMNSKIQEITEKLKPKNLKDLRSYLGAVIQMNRFIPNLAQLFYNLRPFLRREQTWSWNETHDKAFEEFNQQIKRVVKVGHFNRISQKRIICHTKKAGLRAKLQQQDKIGWRPTQIFNTIRR